MFMKLCPERKCEKKLKGLEIGKRAKNMKKMQKLKVEICVC